MKLPPLNEFVEEYVQGFIEGQQDKLESMAPEQINEAIEKAQGFATGYWQALQAGKRMVNQSWK